MDCKVCGTVDEYYDENAEIFHANTPKHICNMILANYKINKKFFSKNRDGIIILASAATEEISSNKPSEVKSEVKVENTDHHKIRIYAKPNQKVKYSFEIKNDMKKEDLLVVGVQLAHPQHQFQMNNHSYIFGEPPHILQSKNVINDVSVTFEASDIGQFEMPIMFTFHRITDKKNLIFIRELVAMVQENAAVFRNNKTPFTNEDWKKSEHFIPSSNHESYEKTYKIPKPLKILLPRGLDDTALEGLKCSPVEREELRLLLNTTRELFDEGINKNSYLTYFHYLLWWEEIIARINLRKYNMFGVTLEKIENRYKLQVPGLAENRPSLLRGDKVYVRPQDNNDYIFESVIKDIEDDYIQIAELDERFQTFYTPEAKFDIRFLMSRVPKERMHHAVTNVFTSKQSCRLFPVEVKRVNPLKPIPRYYNALISTNSEQKSAVQHILSGTSGKAPYMVFGPPGTGKTVTIVEAIIQIVISNPKNRVLVCTDSNMAADHIALMLLQYNKVLNINNYILRANSQSRVWSVMPSDLSPVSNGTSYESFYPISNAYFSSYRIVVTTLLHAAKYCSSRAQAGCKLQMSHLFIDEAAQASEPATLVPITGLLAQNGQLVLAGDPHQLGPVCISREAKDRGLGLSLMERLRESYPNLYCTRNSNYITMLVKNFRSDPDILKIPNELFYENELVPLAKPDPLSSTSILGANGGERAIVFHAVNSREQRMGNAPSYFNEKELEMLKRYTTALITKHKVLPKDIGVIAPYIRQVYKMKGWLMSEKYDDIEVGTVEAFQGKEKRVILVSTVRANCRLLDYDAKYGLGFLVDDKRFNVALTRAKAKLIIIGNPTCLTRDCKWRKYMGLCKDYDCYFGFGTEQMERNSALLTEVARTRFDKCGLTDVLKSIDKNNNKKSEKKK